MQTVVLTSKVGKTPLAEFINTLGDEGAEIVDDQGDVKAYVMTPDREQKRLYELFQSECRLEIDELQRRAAHRGPTFTTTEVLAHLRSLTPEESCDTQ